MRSKCLGAEEKMLPLGTWTFILTLILKAERLQQLNINLNRIRIDL